MAKKITTRIFILALCVVLTGVFFGIGASTAQDVGTFKSLRPQPSKPGYVAMVFHKLIRVKPDFEAWATSTTAYGEANSFDKIIVQEDQAQELEALYSLLTLQDPVYIETPVTLSSYSARNKGFFIQSFKEDSRFDFTYRNFNYAIIPQGIMDKLWIKATDDEAKTISYYTDKGYTLTLGMSVLAKNADGSTPVILDDKEFWLISGEIGEMRLYLAGRDSPLWTSQTEGYHDILQKKLLDLKQ